MPLKIIRNDITKVAADAIVNTANPRPRIGAGTDHAIHEAAGPELFEARKAIGDIAPGESVETPAFGLPAKYVLHTVSPAWIDGRHREEEELREAYDAALNLAHELKCRSVAFPLRLYPSATASTYSPVPPTRKGTRPRAMIPSIASLERRWKSAMEKNSPGRTTFSR